MYSRACTGFQALLGPSSDECQRIERVPSEANIYLTADTRDSRSKRESKRLISPWIAAQRSTVVGIVIVWYI